MTRDELIARLLERPGPDVVAALHAELARHLREDPAAVDAYLAERRLDADLRRLLSPQGGDEAFLKGILAAAAQERMPSQRFVSRVVSRQRRARRWPRLAAIGGILAVAAALVVAFLVAPAPAVREPDRPVAATAPGRLRPGAGSGLVLHRGTGSRPAVADDRFQAGDRLEAPGSGASRLQGVDAQGGPDGTRIDLLGGSRMLVVAAGDDLEFNLETGRLQAEVAPRPADRPLRIRTPHALAVIVGTRFALTVDAERSLLEVEDGKVRFEGAHGAELVAAGEAVVANARGLGRCGPWIDLMPKPGRIAAQVEGPVRPAWVAGSDAQGRWLRQEKAAADSSFVLRDIPALQAGIIECELRVDTAGPGALAGAGFWQLDRGNPRRPMYVGAWHQTKTVVGTRLRLHGVFTLQPDGRIATDMIGTEPDGTVERSVSDDARRDRNPMDRIDRISVSCAAAVVEFRALRVRAINLP